MTTVEAQNKDGNVNAATFTQQATSGNGSAVKAVSANSSAAALHICGAGDLISAKDSAGAEQFKVAQSGNTTVDGTLTTAAGITATTGNLTSTAGSLVLSAAGQGITVKEGANARMGVVTLSSGAATVATTAVTANSRIFLTGQEDGSGTEGFVRVSARTPATSFVITSSQGTDNSIVAWLLVEPS